MADRQSFKNIVQDPIALGCQAQDSDTKTQSKIKPDLFWPKEQLARIANQQSMDGLTGCRFLHLC